MAAHFEEVSEENNKNILEKLNQLKKNKDSDENATFTDVLKGYLMKLNKWMITKETSAILKQLPSTGKLLSEVCKNYGNEVSDVLVDCIIQLSNVPRSLHSSSDLERKVGQWATEQLQICLSYSMTKDDIDFMEQLGITQNEFIDAQIEEISYMIETEGETAEANECHQCKMAKILFPCINEPSLINLIQSFIRSTEKYLRKLSFHCGQSKHYSLETFLDALTRKRDLVKILTDESQVSLWRCYLPAFELEVLDILKIAMENPFIDNHSIGKAIKDQHQLIVKYCGQESLLFESAFSILRAAMHETGCFPAITSLINELYIAIHQEQLQMKTIGCLLSTKLFAAFPISFEGISIEEQESVIKMMNEEIRQLNESQMTSRSDLWFKMVQNKHVINWAIYLSLNGSPEVLDCCLDLLILFYFPASNTKTASLSHAEYKKIFKSFTMNIKCLLRKNLLQSSDLSYPIDFCNRSINNAKNKMKNVTNVMPNLLRDLVLRFLGDAFASHCILKEIFSLITTGLSYRVKLDLWLRTLEDKLITDETHDLQFGNFCEDKRRMFVVFSSCLLDRAKSELSNLVGKISDNSREKQLNSIVKRFDRVSSLLNS